MAVRSLKHTHAPGTLLISARAYVSWTKPNYYAQNKQMGDVKAGDAAVIIAQFMEHAKDAEDEADYKHIINKAEVEWTLVLHDNILKWIITHVV